LNARKDNIRNELKKKREGNNDEGKVNGDEGNLRHYESSLADLKEFLADLPARLKALARRQVVTFPTAGKSDKDLTCLRQVAFFNTEEIQRRH